MPFRYKLRSMMKFVEITCFMPVADVVHPFSNTVRKVDDSILLLDIKLNFDVRKLCRSKYTENKDYTYIKIMFLVTFLTDLLNG